MNAATITEAQPALAIALQAINNCLDKIKKQGTKKPTQQTYAGAVTAIGQKKCVNLLNAPNLSFEPKHHQNIQDMLKEQKKAKELIIRIIDAKEKKDLQLITTKDLVKKL